jgi:hypothetical protein
MTAAYHTVIALKTGRANNFGRVLQFIESSVIQPDSLNKILTSKGLLEKCDQFGHKLLGDKR